MNLSGLAKMGWKKKKMGPKRLKPKPKEKKIRKIKEKHQTCVATRLIQWP